ncbi:DUF4214 domain-containing protein [Pseudomonas psychrophila]|uniref:DUF4214 domain-containing protein n=1 Tax=Pseudomonas psychrophila TaxID=122355 RepID=A0A8I1KAP5_9PSED|nr:DUF4214 domain-containing protein [Pseudomonas psychrophila]MBJ2259635.1 DUF4214 domain-containing protein [Pseudomonas psychrophila]
MATQAQIAAVQQLYVGYLGRAADSAGQQFWANAIANGTATIASVATGFTLSNEYKATYGGLSTSDLVEQVYNNVLGRAPDADGKAFWVAALANGTVTADTLVATIVTNLGALDQQTINNKVFVAQTYTDTAGTAYNPAAAAAILTGIDSTATSVNTALTGLGNGTYAGVVPGVALINAKVSADAAVAAYAKAAATANPSFDGITDADASGTTNDKDGKISLAEAKDALAVANTARGTTDTKVTLDANLSNANGELAAAKTAATTTAAGSVAVSAYDAANAKAIAAVGTPADVQAQVVLKATATSGVNASVTADSAVTWATLESKTLAATGIESAETLYSVLIGSTLSSAERNALVAEVNKIGSLGTQLVAAADKEVAISKANSDLGLAKTALDTAVTATVANKYVTEIGEQKVAADAVTKAAAADVKVAAAKTVVDQITKLESNVTAANKALTDFASDKAVLVDVTSTVAAATVPASAKNDVFYFTKVGSADFNIAGTGATAFTTGDSVVLGAGYTFNAGALSTGNASTLEFFLVQGAKGVQIVAETASYGSASATTGADGVVAASATDAVSVITLTGVTIDHVAVGANGVVSYV